MTSDELATLKAKQKFWKEKIQALYDVRPAAWTPDMVDELRGALTDAVQIVSTLIHRVGDGEQKFLDKAALELMGRLVGQHAEADGTYLAERAYDFATDLLCERVDRRIP